MPTIRPLRSTELCPEAHDFSALPGEKYAYLLGAYLGDGHLARRPRGVWRLRISTDAAYPGIIEECRLAMEAIMIGQRAHTLSPSPRCVVISMYSKHWVCLFPQRRPGRKHERPINLQPWQQRLVRRDAKSFVRGLIHSDGCRVIANDRGLRCARYYFSNRSEDIKGLFCDALDSLGIHWTRPNDRQIAIYRREAVTRLDQFIGPKR